MTRPSWEWFWNLVDRFSDQVAEWSEDLKALREELDRNQVVIDSGEDKNWY